MNYTGFNFIFNSYVVAIKITFLATDKLKLHQKQHVLRGKYPFCI